MNRGLNLVKGDIIGFLNGGDRLANVNVFSDIVKSFEKYRYFFCIWR